MLFTSFVIMANYHKYSYLDSVTGVLSFNISAKSDNEIEMENVLCSF